jgi:diguanylate cyclase (GGDEF)-like protein/PAS domain S-box-containing protein
MASDRNDRERFFLDSPYLMALFDEEGRLVDANPAWLGAMSLTFEEARGRGLDVFVAAEDRLLLERAFRNSGGTRATVELRLRGGDGPFWGECTLFHDVATGKTFVTVADISARITEDRALAAAEAFLERLYGALPQVSLMIFLREGRFVLLGRGASGLLGQGWGSSFSVEELLHDEDLPLMESARERLRRLGDGETCDIVLRLRHHDGTYRAVLVRATPFRRDEGGEVLQVLASAVDITDQKRREEHALDQACRDELTGLRNRRALVAALEKAVAAGEPFALLYLDLDRFKEVNDTFGHAKGDALLCLVGRTLASSLRRGDVAARLGGDEFVLFLPGRAGREEAFDVASRLRAALASALRQDGGAAGIRCSCSVGVGLFPDDGIDAEELLAFADEALYRAKAAGRNCVR